MEKEDKLFDKLSDLTEEERKKIIYNLTEEEREENIKRIVDKLSNNRKKEPGTITRTTKWKDEAFVRKIILEYVKYLTVNRNEDETIFDAIITEGQAFKHLEETFRFRNKPNLEKTKSIMDVMDNFLGKDNSNIVLKKCGRVVFESKDKMIERMEMLKEFDYLEKIVEVPRKLVISPDYFYARLNYFSQMLKQQNEGKVLKSLSPNKVFSDKDPFTEGNRVQITDKRKAKILEMYGKKGVETDGRRSITDDAEVFGD